jgi:hypothetical protein
MAIRSGQAQPSIDTSLGHIWCINIILFSQSLFGQWMVYCDLRPRYIFIKSADWISFTAGIAGYFNSTATIREQM